MTSWDYTIRVENTTASFTLAHKNAKTYEFVGLTIAGTSFDHIDQCNQVYQAVSSIINDNRCGEIVSKCAAVVSQTDRDIVMLLVRVCVQYGSVNLTKSVMKHYNLTVSERLRALDWANASGYAMIRQAMFADITGVYECGTAKVTYTIVFGDAVAPTFAYEGKDTNDMMACVEFANELAHACTGITSVPELVDLSKLVRAYMLPERKEDACVHAPVPAPNDRIFNVTYGGMVYQISTVPALHPCNQIVPNKLRKICEQLQMRCDITDMVDCDLRTWYEIAMYLGYTDVAEKMRWRRFGVDDNGRGYTVAFDRSELAWKPISADPVQVRSYCDTIIRYAKQHHPYHMCQTTTDYNRIYSWVSRIKLPSLEQKEFDLLMADRAKW